jgi:hypothetical protein
MIWMALESQTDWAAAESAGQERSIPVIDDRRERKSEMVWSVLVAAAGRTEVATG